MVKKNDENVNQKSLIPDENETNHPKEEASKKALIKGNKKQDKWFVALKWNQLLKVLAGAYIGPLSCYVKGDEDLQNKNEERIIIRKNGLINQNNVPENLNDFTALIEININLLSLELITGINGEKIESKIQSLNDLSQYDILLFLGAISVSNIEAIHFESEVDKENFILKSYENHPNNKTHDYDIFELKVTSELFNNSLLKNAEEKIQNLELPNLKTNLRLLNRKVDGYLGGVALLINTIPASQIWFDFLRGTLSSIPPEEKISLRDSKISKNLLEQKLFDYAFNKLILNKNKGPQGKVFLETLVKELDTKGLDKKSLGIFKKWYETSLAILNNERDVPKLTDKGMKVGRAILLMLLRPKYQDVLSSKNSSLEPGDDVLALASILVGAKYGLATLSNEYKSNESSYFTFSNRITDLFNAHLINEDLKERSFEPALKNSQINVTKSKFGDLGQSYEFKVNEKILFKRDDQGPDELVKVLINARTSSKPLHFDIDRDNMCLKYQYEFPEGRHQTVFVSVGQPTNSGAKTLRVWSPCLNLKTFASKYNFELLDGIMKMHSFPDTRCRIGLNENQDQLIVMRDQMVESTGTVELEMIEHVAQFADDFEKRFGNIDQY